MQKNEEMGTAEAKKTESKRLAKRNDEQEKKGCSKCKEKKR
jgi:hypothetical protein